LPASPRTLGNTALSLLSIKMPRAMAAGLSAAGDGCSTSSRSTSLESTAYLQLCSRDIEDIVDHGEQVRGCVAWQNRWRAQLMAHVGDEFGFYLAGELGFDARAVFGNPGAMAQDGLGQHGRVVPHEGGAPAGSTLSRDISRTETSPLVAITPSCQTIK
jgi:hypothetical protein